MLLLLRTLECFLISNYATFLKINSLSNLNNCSYKKIFCDILSRVQLSWGEIASKMLFRFLHVPCNQISVTQFPSFPPGLPQMPDSPTWIDSLINQPTHLDQNSQSSTVVCVSTERQILWTSLQLYELKKQNWCLQQHKGFHLNRVISALMF